MSYIISHVPELNYCFFMGFALFVSPQYSLCTGSFIILAVVVVVIIIITSLLNHAGGVEKVRM